MEVFIGASCFPHISLRVLVSQPIWSNRGGRGDLTSKYTLLGTYRLNFTNLFTRKSNNTIVNYEYLFVKSYATTCFVPNRCRKR